MNRTAIALFAFTILAAGPQASIHAQCDTNQMIGRVLVAASDTTIYWNVSAAYQFEIDYGICKTIYTITETKLNDTRLPMFGWCNHKATRDLTTSQLADVSHTEAFTVHTGDTVSFYRELMWLHASQGFSLSHYYALDTLAYAVELVEVGTGDRMALLDSIGLMRRDTPGTAAYWGSAPSTARVIYLLPPALDGRSCMLRMRLYARGDGEYEMLRYDRITADLSKRTTDPLAQPYILQP